MLSVRILGSIPKTREVRDTVNIKCLVPWTCYIVVPYGSVKSWYRFSHPNPARPAAVLHGCTSMLGSGSAAMAADVAAVL